MTDEERAGIAGQKGLSELSKELSEAEVRAKTEQAILREYSDLNLDPIYCATSDPKFAGLLVSSSLVRLINKSRLPSRKAAVRIRELEAERDEWNAAPPEQCQKASNG
jgi:hypothetical protein